MLNSDLKQHKKICVDLNDAMYEEGSIKMWKKIDFFQVGGVKSLSENNIKKKVKYSEEIY